MAALAMTEADRAALHHLRDLLSDVWTTGRRIIEGEQLVGAAVPAAQLSRITR